METTHPPLGKRGYLWATLAFFSVSLTGQFAFGWYVYSDEQRSHGEEVEMGKFLLWTGKDIMENWQSEFLQIAWQVAGLALFWYVGSPVSKESEERTEEKIDMVLLKVYGEEEGQRVKAELERKWPKA